jgi:hypothetical protein
MTRVPLPFIHPPLQFGLKERDVAVTEKEVFTLTGECLYDLLNANRDGAAYPSGVTPTSKTAVFGAGAASSVMARAGIGMFNAADTIDKAGLGVTPASSASKPSVKVPDGEERGLRLSGSRATKGGLPSGSTRKLHTGQLAAMAHANHSHGSHAHGHSHGPAAPASKGEDEKLMFHADELRVRKDEPTLHKLAKAVEHLANGMYLHSE